MNSRNRTLSSFPLRLACRAEQKWWAFARERESELAFAFVRPFLRSFADLDVVDEE